MNELVIDDSESQFSRALKEAGGNAVTLVKQGEIIGVVMSPERYESMRRTALDRMRATMDRAAAEAKANGLTDEVLEDLLADES